MEGASAKDQDGFAESIYSWRTLEQDSGFPMLCMTIIYMVGLVFAAIYLDITEKWTG